MCGGGTILREKIFLRVLNTLLSYKEVFLVQGVQYSETGCVFGMLVCDVWVCVSMRDKWKKSAR